MSWTTLILLATASVLGIQPDPKMAYVVIEAERVEIGKDQPTWIGFENRGEIVHVSARDAIVKLYPGLNRLDHIDFQKNWLSHDGVLSTHKEIKLNLDAGKIYLFGRIELRKMSRNKWDINYGGWAETLKKACNKAPELFDKFEISAFDTRPDFKISCEQ